APLRVLRAVPGGDAGEVIAGVPVTEVSSLPLLVLLLEHLLVERRLPAALDAVGTASGRPLHLAGLGCRAVEGVAPVTLRVDGALARGSELSLLLQTRGGGDGNTLALATESVTPICH